MTDTLRKAAQAALDALNNSDACHYSGVQTAMSELRRGLAEPQECEWVYDDEGFFQSACKQVSFMPDLAVGHPDEWMTYCYGCGKPIKFVEPKEGDDE